MSLADNVLPFAPGSAAGAPGGAWGEVEVRLPPPRPRIAPGAYEARSATCHVFASFGRTNIEIGFDVYRGPWMDNDVLARIPYFVRYSKRLTPQSRLAQLLYQAGVVPARHHNVSLRVLENKLWAVQVGDTEQTASGTLPYSVVKSVVRHLA